MKVPRTTELLFVILILLVQSLQAQEVADIPPLESHYIYTQVTLEGGMKTTLESLFPDVNFRWKKDLAIMGGGSGRLEGVLNGHVYDLPERFNFLVFDQDSLHGDHTVPADELVVKAFVYLSHLGQTRSYNRAEIGRVNVLPYPFECSVQEEKGYSVEIKTTNYKALVEYDWTRSGGFWVVAEYYFLVKNKEILSGCGVRKSNGNIGEIGTLQTEYKILKETGFWQNEFIMENRADFISEPVSEVNNKR